MGCGCKDVEAIARASAKIVGGRTRKRKPRKKWTPEAEAAFERKHGRPRRTVIRGGATTQGSDS